MRAISIILSIIWTVIYAYGNEFPICIANGAQSNPAIAFDGTNFLVVWRDGRNGLYDIYGTRITPQGQVLDPQGIPISTAPNYQLAPKVAYGSNEYLVVWQDRRNSADYPDIYGARVTPDGIVLDPDGIPIFVAALEQGGPEVCFDGTKFLVACDYRYSTLNHYIKGIIVAPDGSIINTFWISPSDDDNDHYFPAIWGGTSGWDVYWIINDDGILHRWIDESGSQGPISIFFDYLGYWVQHPAVSECNGRRLVVWQSLNPISSVDIYGKFVGGEYFPISTAPASQLHPEIATGNAEFLVVWQDWRLQDIYGARVSPDGNVLEQDGAPICIAPDEQCAPVVGFAEGHYLVVWQDHRNGQWDIYGTLIKKPGILTNDPLALAYNGNRHLVRKPNSTELHLVYTDSGYVVYCYTPYHLAWSKDTIIGQGKFPAIALSSDGFPSICWTDDEGGLWYKRKVSANQWSDIYHLYDPWGYWQARLNSPPSIAITPHTTGDSVHILCTMHSPANGPINWVGEYAFRIDQPLSGSFSEIEGGAGATAGPIRYNPSIARSSIDNSLHAVWQRADTICYATREIGQNWQNWGPRFEQDGLRSAHPFVECYGDMVYVVWEHKVTPWLMEDVYKGWTRSDIQPPNFYWDNLSRTPNTPSRYPVNASGLFTVFQDSPYPPINGPEVYYKVHPEDEPFNISQTIPGSYYPQSVARFVGTRTYLYTAWQDGDNVPYEIKFKKLQYIPMELPAPVYLTSINGNEIPSPYLVARDSFISNWQIPVDIGYQTITYRFPLEPGYRYKIKAVAYHETSGQWREWVKIDGKLKHLIKYNAYEPESLQFWIPPAFYKDGKIDVVFERISGDFATAGSIYIYQYEYEEEATELASGPMAQESHTLNNIGLAIFPNPFRDKLNIRYTISDAGQGFSLAIKIYDVSGGLIKQFNNPSEKIIWDGRDEYGRKVTPGVYFLKVDNPDTKQTFTHKLIKLE
ncbi:MAG: T9SS type A sorting domain-containing protein [candidate division WOR-3 bacterium]